jgi:hypothetical protein
MEAAAVSETLVNFYQVRSLMYNVNHKYHGENLGCEENVNAFIKNTAELGYNVMKGTEHFVSL